MKVEDMRRKTADARMAAAKLENEKYEAKKLKLKLEEEEAMRRLPDILENTLHTIEAAANRGDYLVNIDMFDYKGGTVRLLQKALAAEGFLAQITAYYSKRSIPSEDHYNLHVQWS